MTDFIEVYEGLLPPESCAGLIRRFEASGQARRGQTGGGLDTTLKDSWDIQLDTTPGWSDASQLLNGVMLAGFRHYLRRYAHVALAPLQLKLRQPSGEMVLVDAGQVAGMSDEMLSDLIATVFRPGSINIQKYVADEGGYPYWHSEQYPRHDQGEALHRVLLWTIYLNEGFSEGETEFLYQQRKIAPRSGSLLIAPGGFTHTHRGNRPRGGHKYIATSWILYQRAAKLYGPPSTT